MNGRLVLQKDQKPDNARVRALRRLVDEKILVGLIIGKIATSFTLNSTHLR